MNERILTNKNHGMRALVLWILAFVASIFLCVIGSSLVDTFGGSHVEGALGVFLLVLGILWVSFSWIFLCGLKVLKPQEALVLTLFGKYVGTLKGEGFYYVNPFCVAVNPAAKTRLNQSGDVDGGQNRLTLSVHSGGNGAAVTGDAAGKKDLPEDHDPQQQPTEDQRLPGQSGGDRHCGDVAGGGYGQGGIHGGQL